LSTGFRFVNGHIALGGWYGYEVGHNETSIIPELTPDNEEYGRRIRDHFDIRVRD